MHPHPSHRRRHIELTAYVTGCGLRRGRSARINPTSSTPRRQNMDQIVSYPATEETYDRKRRPQDLLRSWRPEGKPRAVDRHLPRRERPGGSILGRGAVRRRAAIAVYALDLRGRGDPKVERLLRRGRCRLRRRCCRHSVEGSPSRRRTRPTGLPSSATGGWRHLRRLHARQSDGAGRLHLRGLRLPGAGAQFRDRGDQGPSHIAPHLPTLTLKNEDFTRDPKTRSRRSTTTR